MQFLQLGKWNEQCRVTRLADRRESCNRVCAKRFASRISKIENGEHASSPSSIIHHLSFGCSEFARFHPNTMPCFVSSRCERNEPSIIRTLLRNDREDTVVPILLVAASILVAENSSRFLRHLRDVVFPVYSVTSTVFHLTEETGIIIGAFST